jgi:hypothetical protein
VLLAGSPAIAYGDGVGVGAWMPLYASGRAKLREYSPVLLAPLSTGSRDFFWIFRIGILRLSGEKF